MSRGEDRCGIFRRWALSKLEVLSTKPIVAFVQRIISHIVALMRCRIIVIPTAFTIAMLIMMCQGRVARCNEWKPSRGRCISLGIEL